MKEFLLSDCSGRPVMDICTRKSKMSSIPVQDQTLMLTHESAINGFSIRLAGGASWDKRSVELAMLVAQGTYLDKLHVPQPVDDAGLRMNQVTIRRNHFEPYFEPSRHEMRIFDALDGIVTEM